MFHWVLSTLQLLASKCTTTKSKTLDEEERGSVEPVKIQFPAFSATDGA